MPIAAKEERDAGEYREQYHMKVWRATLRGNHLLHGALLGQRDHGIERAESRVRWRHVIVPGSPLVRIAHESGINGGGERSDAFRDLALRDVHHADFAALEPGFAHVPHDADNLTRRLFELRPRPFPMTMTWPMASSFGQNSLAMC